MEIEAEIKDIDWDETLALAAKLNTMHGKRLSVSALAGRIKLLVEEKGWSQQKAAGYFGKDRSWISHYIHIQKFKYYTYASSHKIGLCFCRRVGQTPPEQTRASLSISPKNG